MNSHKHDDVDDFDPTANAWYRPVDPTATSPIEPQTNEVESRLDQIHQLSLMLHQPDELLEASLPFRTPTETNHRQYSRCPIAEERTTGILTMNGRSFDCRLVEMSIGGFGVVLLGRPALIPGTVGSFLAPGLNYVVSVTRVEGRPGGAYVGLKQIEEVIDSNGVLEPQHSTALGYVVAGISGALIAFLAFSFMNSN